MFLFLLTGVLSSLAALVPSLAARQLKESSGPSLGNRLVKRALPSSSPTQSSSSINRVFPVGPPAEVVYVLILFLVFLFIIHVLGHITQPGTCI